MAHSDESMVRSGQVREMNRAGNDSADEAAAHGRRRVHERVLGAKCHVSGNCGVWYSRVRDLHRFFIATARAIVSDYGLGGIVFDPCVWSVGSLPTRRSVREGDQNCATLLGPRSLPGGRCGFLPVAVQKTEATCFSIEDDESTCFQNPQSRSRLVARSNHWDPGLHIRYGNTNQQIADI